MSILRGFLILVLFFLLGEALRLVFLVPISGGILGLMMLTLYFMATGGVGNAVASASQALISVLILLIMPGLTEIFFISGKFTGQWLAVSVSLLVGTFLSVVTTLVLLNVLARKLPSRSNTHE
ncbi:murein hydrolase transporter LrgA [Marinobacter psychrophilus]|jgi:holin-like protein|uniref:Murein hydrolase transporter LrgA n=1 Tax=Marinobacter psychrophilus TaxID=330734 RepID=A0A0H4I1B2_9GAMM|nr:CidA/LrgA family protein [Marinobacter psychrophilus]AKO51410.1 murein hydrolase transporter LrgA [Marinobacter psychrophilus]